MLQSRILFFSYKKGWIKQTEFIVIFSKGKKVFRRPVSYTSITNWSEIQYMENSVTKFTENALLDVNAKYPSWRQ